MNSILINTDRFCYQDIDVRSSGGLRGVDVVEEVKSWHSLNDDSIGQQRTTIASIKEFVKGREDTLDMSACIEDLGKYNSAILM